MLTFFQNAVAFLQGKKTYIIAIIAILSALVAFLEGQLPLLDFLYTVGGALGLTTLRAGIGNAANKAAK